MQGDASEPSLSSSDAETPKAAAGRGSPELRRRSLLPWRRSEEQAFRTEVDHVGSEGQELLLAGQLVRLRGWWRQGAKFEERRASVLGSELLFGDSRRVSLLGVAVECFEVDGVHGFRLLPAPTSGSEPIELATESSDQRDLWMAAISIASQHKSSEPVAGVLRLTLVEASFLQELSVAKRLQCSGSFFCAVSIQGLSCRTVARKGGEQVAFGDAFELPISDDDPDSLVDFQVWSTDHRHRGTLRGRASVPLFHLGRNKQREIQLVLRNVEGPKDEVATMKAWCCFEQDLGALLLPRPQKPAPAAWQTVGNDKSIREQFKELESFMQQFEIFSSRFMYHSDTFRGLSLEYKRMVQWDRPLISALCLIALTVLIGFFHEYLLPVSVLLLLAVILWYHPGREEMAEALEAQEQPRSVRAVSGLKVPQKVSEGDEEVEERYENERRLLLGRFTARRLRFWDPPAWSDRLGRRAEPPKVYEEGVQYSWRVEVNASTDADGWRYARSFGRGTVWRNSFQPQMFVRRRRHVGRPLNEAKTPKGEVALLPSMEDGKSAQVRTPRPSISTPEVVRHDSNKRGSADTSQGKALEFGIARTPFHDMYQQYLLRLGFLQRQIEYWMDWYERRKNLVLGGTAETQNFALVLVVVLLILSWLLPTRVLCLAFFYGLFWDGLNVGRLMREHRKVFLRALKEAAVENAWLESEDAKCRASSWTLGTSLDELVDAGVQHLQLRDWIRNQYFAGRPMLPLRLVQRCRSLRDLAALVTTMSDCFAKRRQRARVWYRSTFRNLLEHVPSDITRFQPFVARGA